MKNALWAVALLVLAALTITPAHAWDCSLPANVHLAECQQPIPIPQRHPSPIPKRNPGRPLVNHQEQAQHEQQTQTQQQSASGGTGGAGGSAAGGDGGMGGAATANATASSVSTASAQQTQTANGGAASNAGNAQSTSYASTTNIPRQAVEAWSVGTNSTANCVRDQHAGIGAVVGGLSWGRGKRDKDCARQEIAADLWAHGQYEAGDRIYCAITEVKEALGAECLTLIHHTDTVIVVPPAPPADVVTHAELREIEARMVSHGIRK